MLWRRLRFLKSEGFHFRRQVPITEYVADFACHRAHLIIELVGGQHNETQGIAHDAIRSADVAAVMDQIRLAPPLAIDLARTNQNDPHP